MIQVKSLVAGLVHGVNGAMEVLDRMTRELSAKRIQSITDTYYSAEQGKFDAPPGPHIVRVVIYEDSN